MKQSVLYVGSGSSALLVKELDLSKYTVCGVNNAWRLFDSMYAWIHSGDFLLKSYPNPKNYEVEVNHPQYASAVNAMAEELKWEASSPQHYVGYTIFFLGLYWVIATLRPKKISLLGFDHDYDQAKVDKWLKDKQPNIQNSFHKNPEKPGSPEWRKILSHYHSRIDPLEWADNFFKGHNKDAFYGHGTPDPMRLGREHLLKKFNLAKQIAEQLDIELVNLSPVESGINTFEKEAIPTTPTAR